MVRTIGVTVVAGTLWVQQWGQLWSSWGLWAATLAVIALFLSVCYVRLPRTIKHLTILSCALLVALLNTNIQASQRLVQQLPVSEENKAFKLLVQIEGLARLNPASRAVTATVLRSHPVGVPEQIMLVWSQGTWRGPYAKPKTERFPELIPGQQWAVTAYVKTPHGARNTGGFDYEGYMFAQGIRAIAQVRGVPELISETPEVWSLGLMAQRWRYALRDAMLPYLQSLRWGGVVLALSIGDQASIHSADWRTFNRTGLTHLVSISGSHVTMLASVSAWVFAWVWRRLRVGSQPLAQYLPAQLAAAWLALLLAGLYSLIAGWEVPARRTFFMFAVAVACLSLRLPFTITQIVAWAAIGIVLFDPWAVLASGFWLSFGAVLLLVCCAGWTGSRLSWRAESWWRRYCQHLVLASKWQLAISIALLPPLAFLFFEMSLVSPFSNAYGIPLIGLVITPLALVFAITSVLGWVSLASGVLAVCHFLLELTMRPTEWLAQLSLASLPASKAPVWVLALAIGGVLVALAPKALRGAVLGWGFILPALFWRGAPIDEGDWRLHVLDVGQGSAIIIETRDHTFLFDTGVRRAWDSDEGERTVVPYLHSLGKLRLDGLILSHADLDHVGGTLGVLERMQVAQIYSPFDVESYLRRELRLLQRDPATLALPAAISPCQRGVSWEVDGIRFRFVWPNPTHYDSGSVQDKNAHSCVLVIQGRHRSAVLTGDVGHAQEKQLVEAGLESQDVVVVGHHGSKTSSSALWVQQMQAQVAVAQVGWWSRFGHPHQEVVQRWEKEGTMFYRTDWDGAVVIHAKAEQLLWSTERSRAARYWQNGFSRP